MAVRSLKNSGITNFAPDVNSMLAGYSIQDFHHLETVQLGGNAASVTFSNLLQYSGEFRHLQVRIVSRNSAATTGAGGVWLTFNGDTSNNYRWHRLYGTANTVTSQDSGATNMILAGINDNGNNAANAFSPTVFDVIDAFVSKNKTIRNLSGCQIGGQVQLGSGLWLSTSPVSSMTVITDSNHVAGSRFSLYGIR